MKLSKTFIPLFISVIILHSDDYATSKYVATTGNDINAGTINSPYLTIIKAISVVSAGDTIYVRGGIYTDTTIINISKSGTSASKYYLFAYPGERPILDFSGMAVLSANRAINLKGSYWHIKGIDIKGAGDNGMNISKSNNIIENCAFYENRDTGLQLGGGASNNQIINCDSYFNADPANGNADGFAPKLDVGTGNYFYGCRAWQNSDDGWDGYLRPADGVETTLENCWCFRNGYLKNGSASSGNGNGFKMGGMDVLTDSLRHRMILKNCIAFDNRVKGFDENNNRGSMTLLNCTAYRNGTNYSIPGPLKSGETLTIKNCIALGSYGTLWSYAVQATNSWLSPFAVPTEADFISVDTTGVRGARNPDGSLPDVTFFHLASGSQFIDAGTNVGIAFNGSAPDLGYYESGIPLPVELTSFTAAAGKYNAMLSWNVASEVNAYGYEILRREIGKTDAIQVGFVKARGAGAYNFDDANVKPGYYIYELKQVDNDGAYKIYSSAQVVVGIASKELTLGSYPNPFNPTANIEFTLPQNGFATLKVFNVIGQEVATLFNGNVEAGIYNKVTFNASQLSSGMYFSVLESGNQRIVKKMLMTK